MIFGPLLAGCLHKPLTKPHHRSISVTELSAGYVLGTAFRPDSERLIRQKKHVYVTKGAFFNGEQVIDKIVFEEYGHILQDVTISVSASNPVDVKKLDLWIAQICLSFGTEIRQRKPDPNLVSRASLSSHKIEEKQCAGRQAQVSGEVRYEKTTGEQTTNVQATIYLRNEINRPRDI